MVTLRFLATGDSYPSLGYAFRIHPSTICNIIWETCNVLWGVLHPIYLKPLTEDEWIQKAAGFYNMWQLPNCLGAMDGKHIRIQAPANSGCLFHNYKKYFSTVMLAVCDASYFFVYVNIGSYGAQSDGGILQNTEFGQKLKNGNLNIPVGNTLPYTKDKVPLFFVADEAFPLQINLMRPFSRPRAGLNHKEELIFNYRLSRARRTIENTFGIMVARFRIFHREINGHPETVDAIVKATTCLHNFIKKQKQDGLLYCAPNFTDREINGTLLEGEWRHQVPINNALTNEHLRFGNRNAKKEAWDYRNFLKDYLNGFGRIDCPWQNDHI